MIDKSTDAFEKANQIFPGGVNSPVRAFKHTGVSPRFIERAAGSQIFDVDGNAYFDFVASFGPQILGHNNEVVLKAAHEALFSGTSFGAPVQAASRLGELIKEALPSIERLRFVNSGTEAVMTAIRLARAYTKRNVIVKFDGHYHGHSDAMLVAAGSGMQGRASSAGIPEAVISDTLSIPFNDIAAVEEVFAKRGSEVAAVIVEPLPGNMGLVPANDGFLKKIREITAWHDSLLIFDEVITGFRVAFGGIQTLENIKPDITTLGKIIGAGFPVGCVGGRREILEQLAPLGSVYQAGTLSGNPLAMAAGLAQLNVLSQARDQIYPELSSKTRTLCSYFEDISGIAVQTFGSLFTIFFTGDTSAVPENLDDVKGCNDHAYALFHEMCLAEGLYVPPAQMETAFISTAFTDAEIHEIGPKFRKIIFRVLERIQEAR